MKVVHPRNETLQLVFLLIFLFTVFLVFFCTPALRPASFITVLNLLFMAPLVNFMERRKIPRVVSILVLFSLFGIVLVFGLTRAALALSSQWSSLVATLPVLAESSINKLGHFQNILRDSLDIDFDFGLSNWLIKLERNIQDWTLTHAPTILGDIVTASLLGPIFSFFLLKDGALFKANIRKLIPETYSEVTIQVIRKISVALSQFLRAKLLEAVLVFIMTYIGLKIVSAPYSAVFAVIAGVTNIIPYLGPLLGAAPALILTGFSDFYLPLFWPVLTVFLIVNAIDMVLVFPVFVAKLVNLSPLTLLASVALGQELYGLFGMLIAVPLASVLKIILHEIVQLVYSAD